MLHMTLQGCTRPELDTWKGWQLCHHMTLQGCTRPELDTWKVWQLCHHMTLQGCTTPDVTIWLYKDAQGQMSPYDSTRMHKTRTWYLKGWQLIIKSAKKGYIWNNRSFKNNLQQCTESNTECSKKRKITANIDPYAKNCAKFYFHRYAYIVLFEE